MGKDLDGGMKAFMLDWYHGSIALYKVAELINLCIVLQMLGVYDWEGSNPMPPEFWTFSTLLPFHPCKSNYN